jgi:hypothetical protein
MLLQLPTPLLICVQAVRDGPLGKALKLTVTTVNSVKVN